MRLFLHMVLFRVMHHFPQPLKYKNIKTKSCVVKCCTKNNKKIFKVSTSILDIY